MKRHRLSPFTLLASTTLLTGLIASLVTPASQAQINPKFAQQLISEVFESRCTRATEVSYRSNQLATQEEGGTRVYINAVLRKIVTPGSALRADDTASQCAADARQTTQQELVIQSPTETRRVTLTPYNDSYLIYHLQSFSPDGQHLVADLQSVYPGGSGGNNITVFNLSGENVTAINPEVCGELESASFYGFATQADAIVRCEGYLNSSQAFETINVRTGVVRRLSGTPTVMNYGLADGAPVVTKIQAFQ